MYYCSMHQPNHQIHIKTLQNRTKIYEKSTVHLFNMFIYYMHCIYIFIYVDYTYLYILHSYLSEIEEKKPCIQSPPVFSYILTYEDIAYSRPLL